MNLYGSEKYDRILSRRPHTAGKEPGARVPKLSEYGKQLLEKQKVCGMYGINDRKLRSIFTRSSLAKGQTDRMMRLLLERRLDNVVFRAGLSLTRLQSRQFVSHGIFKVNGKRVKTASFLVEAGDKITVRDQTKASPAFTTIVTSHERYVCPQWLIVDMPSLAIEVKNLPSEDKDFEQAIDITKVIGFYSR